MALREKEHQVALLSQRIERFEEETLRQYESNEKLCKELNKFQEKDVDALLKEKKSLTQLLREAEERLAEQESVYTQKISFLKRDIELKNHQLESLNKLMNVKDLRLPANLGKPQLGRNSSIGLRTTQTISEEDRTQKVEER